MRSVWFMTLLMLSLGLAGCLDGPTVSTSGQGDTRAEELVLPTWEVGDQWLYTFTTPQFGEDSARLVVAEVDDENGLYRLGISNEREAQRHAVINHNPFLGRITMDGLSVYEQGEAQPVFNFPWEKGQTWSFTLFGQAWTASTVSIYNGVVDVLADSEDGHRLMYAFSGREGFLDSLTNFPKIFILFCAELQLWNGFWISLIVQSDKDYIACGFEAPVGFLVAFVSC